MKKLLTLLTVALPLCIFASGQTPISTQQTASIINPELVDQNDLSQLAVKFNGPNNPQVVLVLDNAVMKYFDGNPDLKWKTIHSGTGWDGGLYDAGGGTTKVVSNLKVQFNKDSNPYIVVGEWGGFVDFYNGSSWKAISNRNFYYSDVSSLNVKFNSTDNPSVIAGFGQGDGDINLYNGNPELSWIKINPRTNWNFFTKGYTTQNVFVDQDDKSYPPNLIAYMKPIVYTSPQFICYYDSKAGTWSPLVVASSETNGIGEVYAKFDNNKYKMVFSTVPNSDLPVQKYRIVYYDGLSFVNLLDTDTPMSGLFDVQFNQNGKPYVLASTQNSGLEFYSGKKWNKIPSPDINITKLYTQFNGNNTPYVVVADQFNVVKFFNGKKWVLLNSGNLNLSQNPVNGKSSIMRVHFNESSNPYIVLADIENDAAFFFNGSKWATIYKDAALAKEHQEEPYSEAQTISSINFNKVINQI